MADLALAVDIGGTKLAAGLVALDGTLVHRAMHPTPASAGPGDAEVLWDALAAVVEGVIAQVGQADRLVVCGTGCGGPMSPGGDEVSPLNIEGWRSFPLRSRLAALTGLPTFVDNDAKALALGEGWVGAAKGCDDYIAMVVSTGVGGGLWSTVDCSTVGSAMRATWVTSSSSPTGAPVCAAAGDAWRRRRRARRWKP